MPYLVPTNAKQASLKAIGNVIVLLVDLVPHCTVGTVAGTSSGASFTFPIAFSSVVYGIQGISKSSTFSSVPASFDDSKTSLTGSAAGFRGGSGNISWFAYGR